MGNLSLRKPYRAYLRGLDLGRQKASFVKRMGVGALLVVALVMGANQRVQADTTTTSVIAPVVLQFCAPTAVVQRRASTIVATDSVVNENSGGINSMDLSFVNTTMKNIKIVVVRIGGTEVANIGKFAPDVTIKWRIPAMPGPCSLRAVRFEDGTEWAAPPLPAPSASPGK
jgi:hypothetical protein